MLVSTNWLKDFVFLPDALDKEELSMQLTMHSVEVEEIKKLGSDLQNVVVGVVTSVKKHPDADKLNVCLVDDGSTEIPIVCGGSNVVEGMKVALGKIGASVLWHGEGEPVVLKKTKIRGEVSEGMICAAEEIGLGTMSPKKDEKEILDISHLNAKAGTELLVALGMDDMVIDIENKTMTHRPDLWGHYGLARELAAIQGKKLNAYNPAKIKESKENKIKVTVEDKELCPRYMAVMMDGIEITDSPAWMQSRLLAVGIQPINNIVDITSYVMLELGQPMHAFDANTIEDNSIIVRRAEKKEQFTTLNDVDLELDDDMLVIADTKKSVAIAGVKGDKVSGVTNSTTSIIFESANFNAISVRKTAQKVATRTDSSTRFEKTLDPNMCELALRRAVELTKEICSGSKVVSNVADVSNFKLDQGPIELTLSFLRQKIGAEIKDKEIIKSLERLGFSVKLKKDKLSVIVPTWRATKDIKIAEDVVEEVARMYGYGEVETSLPAFSITPPPENALRTTIAMLHKIAAYELGLNEVLNYSFVSPELLSKLDITPEKHIELDNPVAKDRPFLRRGLLPNLLERVEENLHRNDSVAFFEVGRVFIAEESGERTTRNSSDLLPKQDTFISAAFAEKGNKEPYYYASHAARTLLERLGADVEIRSTEDIALTHPGRVAEVLVSGTSVGFVSELHPKLAAQMGIDERVGIMNLNINAVVEAIVHISPYNQLSVFPAVMRDLAIVVDTEIQHADIEKTISEVDSLISEVELFDVYVGKNVKEGTKSLAYHLTYRSHEKTLEANDVDAIHAKVVNALEKKFKAEIRS